MANRFNIPSLSWLFWLVVGVILGWSVGTMEYAHQAARQTAEINQLKWELASRNREK